MSGDALPKGAFVPPADAVGSGAPLQTVETVSLRIGTDREGLQVEQSVSPGVQLRKIMPGSEIAPAFDPTPIGGQNKRSAKSYAKSKQRKNLRDPP